MPILNLNNGKPYSERSMFLDGSVDIARYDQIKYTMLDKLVKQQRGFFWVPEEIQDINRDKDDFRKLTPHEQHIFISNLLRQTLLDSVQGRAPSEAFTPISSVPEMEIWAQTWAFSETIHSYSYTYIIRNVFANPSEIFDKLTTTAEVTDTAEAISSKYDDLIEYNQKANFIEGRYEDTINIDDHPFGCMTLYEHKKRLWLALMAVNILEGVRFYVSFACSWSFAERKLMEGNAKIIKLIARDENLHLAGTQYILRTLRKEDPDFEKIAQETEAECVKMFEDCVEQEKKWAEYLFKDGSMIGLNEMILKQYVEWIAKQRMKAVDLPCNYEITTNPLPWTAKWIGGKEMQDAPQEVSKSQYIVGGIKPDIGIDTFKGMKL